MHLPPKATRLLSRSVKANGKELGLSFVEVNDGKVAISPFKSETHSTVFVRRIILNYDENNILNHIEIINN